MSTLFFSTLRSIIKRDLGDAIRISGVIQLRIDNSGWSVKSSALFDVAGMRLY